MYRLFHWKTRITVVVTVVALLVVNVDHFEVFTGIDLPDHALVRYLPKLLVLLLTLTFALSNRWAPWRLLWKIIPPLNTIFPDINGVWRGYTHSNWPIIEKMFEASQTDRVVSQEELHSIPLRSDALAIEIKATLFKVQIIAWLSATKGKSHSIIVCPWKDMHKRLHLTYVYEQEGSTPSATDTDKHFGATDLIIEMENLNKASGDYWTRRNWKEGHNTAGRIELERIKKWRDKNKPLSDYL